MRRTRVVKLIVGQLYRLGGTDSLESVKNGCN
jgi:hypothetical protein